MRGPLPKPIVIAEREGDTRKRGSRKHAEHLASLHHAQRGVPDRPHGLPARARKHWDYLAGELKREGLLATCDEGMLTMAALLYHAAWEAARGGDWRRLTDVSQRYLMCADRMGLNEVARARLPKARADEDPLEAALCG